LGPVDVQPSPLDPRRLTPYVGNDRVERLEEAAAAARRLLGERRIINVNSSANGGGVAELLLMLLGYALGSGIKSEWLVIRGDAEFFAVTKRIHNGLYGGPGDGGELGGRERAAYERTTADNLGGVLRAVRPGDVVIVHDPQPAGLIPHLVEHGALVVWRCHVGFDGANEWTDRAWEFLRELVLPAHAHVFSRRAFAPPWLDEASVRVIAPSIDPFSSKNCELAPGEVPGLLAAAGVLAGDASPAKGRVTHRAVVLRENGPPGLEVPLVVQVSRWDRMKDMAGVLAGFVDFVDPALKAELVLAGPAVDGVDDDPEGRQIWEETAAQWQALSPEQRARVQLVALPLDDLVENALVVNALQRHATVVVQKSLAEGFGLTVAEAMWKSRPVVASSVGGIVEQIVDGETGILVEPPTDLEGFGRALGMLLDDPALAERLGAEARSRVIERFLPDRQLLEYAKLFDELVAR
jgi:trehalose synthase